MHLTEDTLVFEKGFEFAVYPYVAKVQENDENSFHWHRYCEITLVEKGKGRYFVNGVFEKGFEFAVYPYVAKVQENDENSFHWHRYCEITLVEKGKGRYFVNGREYCMEAGDLIIFNNTEPHGWIGTEEDMHLLVMIFQPEFVSDKLDVSGEDYLRPFAERGGNFQNRIGVLHGSRRSDHF